MPNPQKPTSTEDISLLNDLLQYVNQNIDNKLFGSANNDWRVQSLLDLMDFLIEKSKLLLNMIKQDQVRLQLYTIRRSVLASKNRLFQITQTSNEKQAWSDAPLFKITNEEFAMRLVSRNLVSSEKLIYSESSKEQRKALEVAKKRWESEGRNLKKDFAWSDAPTPF